MDDLTIKLHLNHQVFVDRFISICQEDARIVAAFLGGSYAKDAADEYSDLDLYLITTDEDFKDFYTGRKDFMRLLGEPIFLEDFDIPNIIFYIFPDGTEGELEIGCESQFKQIHVGPYKILVDKKNILTSVVFSGRETEPVEQIETLRRMIYWFWHDLSHFITAMGRMQFWWAQGQLEEMRHYCVSLMRLKNDISDMAAGHEVFFKVEKVLSENQLSVLKATLCPMDENAMLEAGRTLIELYKELAIPLAQKHGVTYPHVLDQIISQRLENLPKYK